jgi:CheY-like chemotaxis protein
VGTLPPGLSVVAAGGDAATRGWLLTTLREAGHRAEHHASGGAALAALERTDAELLIACLDLPDMAAPELVEQAMQGRQQLGVLYVADPHADGLPWADVPAGSVLLYGPSGPDLLPAVAVALARTGA